MLTMNSSWLFVRRPKQIQKFLKEKHSNNKMICGRWTNNLHRKKTKTFRTNTTQIEKQAFLLASQVLRWYSISYSNTIEIEMRFGINWEKYSWNTRRNNNKNYWANARHNVCFENARSNVGRFFFIPIKHIICVKNIESSDKREIYLRHVFSFLNKNQFSIASLQLKYSTKP